MGEQRGGHWLPPHPGAGRGFSALLTLYPDAHRAIVILSNSDTTPRLQIRGAIEAALEDRAIVLPQAPVLLHYRGLIWMTTIALVMAGGLGLWRRRSGATVPRRKVSQ